MAGRPALGRFCCAGGRKCRPAFRAGLIGWRAGNLHREDGLRAEALGPPTAAGRDGQFSTFIIRLVCRLTGFGFWRLSRVEASGLRAAPENPS